MVFLPPTPDLALYLNGLSLLFNVYVSQKRGVAAKLGELIQELKALKPTAQALTIAELEKRLEDKLLPSVGQVETDAVKRDMDLVNGFCRTNTRGGFRLPSRDIELREQVRCACGQGVSI